MRNATLRQLRVFETAAGLSSFSRAAEVLHLSQPAVSAQIRELEGHAGLPLFERLGKRVHLTEAGRELLAHSQTILGQFDEADEAMARLRGVEGGTLSVAVISAAGAVTFEEVTAEVEYDTPEGEAFDADEE